MSDQAAPRPRPVNPAAVAAVFLLLALYWLLAAWVYVPRRAPAAQNAPPERLPKELAWRATPASRRAHLRELREKEALQAGTYRWIDQGAGVVGLPIERAMELVVRERGGAK